MIIKARSSKHNSNRKVTTLDFWLLLHIPPAKNNYKTWILYMKREQILKGREEKEDWMRTPGPEEQHGSKVSGFLLDSLYLRLGWRR